MLTRSLLLAAFLGVPAAAQQPAVPSCPHGAADDEATMVSVVVAGDPVALHLVIDSVLTDLHYRLSTAESSLDQWVTQSKFGWPDGDVLDLGGIDKAFAMEQYLPLWLAVWGAKGDLRFNLRVVS